MYHKSYKKSLKGLFSFGNGNLQEGSGDPKLSALYFHPQFLLRQGPCYTTGFWRRLGVHNRGLPSVMELQTEFVIQVLDILSRPMWWGISREIGSKLPFSHAYFPYKHHLFRILAGPMSQGYFQHLLANMCGSVSSSGGHLCPSSNKATTKMNMIDHKSMWAMVMNFPGWFFYASVLLFYNKIHADSFPSGFIQAGRPFLLHDVEVYCSVGAARLLRGF